MSGFIPGRGLGTALVWLIVQSHSGPVVGAPDRIAWEGRVSITSEEGVEFQGRGFDLNSERELRELDKALARVLASGASLQFASEESSPGGGRSGPMSFRKEVRRIQVLRGAVRSILETPEPRERAARVRDLMELARAVENAHRPPVPPRVDLLQAPWVFWEYSHNPVGRGMRAASDLGLAGAGTDDTGAADPQDSTFWSRPENLASEDLSAGFGRPKLPGLGETICVYHGPKTGFGTAPGFEVRCGGRKLKVKFAETHSEPFAARIFAALGFQVEPTDYVPGLRVAYDRRIFREFNRRKEVSVRVTALLIPTHTIRIQKRYDPFQFISAVLKDGRHVAGQRLKSILFRNPGLQHPEDRPDNFNPAGEAQIAWLLTAPANIHYYTPQSRSIGPWDFDTLGHADRRELRGAALLAGWIGWFDCRSVNTRLKVVRTEHGLELRHFITDLGSCLGKASGLTSRQCEEVDKFGWFFTQPPEFHGRGRMALPFRMVGFHPLGHPGAFREMTWDDARWMGRWIGRLSEAQIAQALVAAGFDPARVRIYTDKLVSRRDQMIRDLGLADEVALLRAGRRMASASEGCGQGTRGIANRHARLK